MMQRRGNIRNAPEEGDGGRVPPHDLDAERNVIGAMLVSEAAAERVTELLGADDFYSETHRVIYRAALTLRNRNQPVDQTTINDELRRTDEFDQVGGRAYIFDLVAGVPMTQNAHRYAGIVSEKATLRRVIDAGMRMADDAFREPGSVSELLEEAEQTVYEIARSGASETAGQTGARQMDELVRDLLERTQDRYENGVMPGISSGLCDLDEITTGWNPGELVIVAARPAMGKSAFALGVTKSAAEAGNAALVFSLEMSSEQMTARMVAESSGIPITEIATGRVGSEDWPPLISATGRVGELPILMDDQANQTITSMRSKVRREAAKLAARGKKLSLVVVDYLQLMVGDRSRGAENRQYEVGDISRGLKVIAREFDVPVIALSQLSRACEQRHDKRPMLSDLRDSGSIEQDADKVLFLYRDEYYDEDTDDKGIAEVIVAKHRNGPTGKVKLAWRAKQASFASLARR